MLNLVIGLLVFTTIASSIRELRQVDFVDGTFIADEDNVEYKIMEDITFHPNPDNDFMPYTDAERCGNYCGAEFVLGFFTVIAIDAVDVKVNLNGHEIKGSEEFLLHQRFYSIIQLGKSPFITGQGPANFGEWTSRVENIEIFDGTLGLSSHHGIFGNNVKGVKIHDLLIKDFEVVGIHINGVEDVEIKDVIIEDILDNVPFDSSISQAHFALHLLNQFDETQLNQKFPNTEDGNLVRNIRDALQNEVDLAMNNGLKPGYDGFFAKQNNGLPDGSFAAGIVLRGGRDTGVAINKFAGTDGAPRTNNKGKNIRLVNIDITGIYLEPVEWVSLNFMHDNNANGDRYLGAQVKGPFGDVMDPRIWKTFSNTGTFVPNVLAAAQFAICTYAEPGQQKSCSNNDHLVNFFEGEDTFADVLQNYDHLWVCNADLMNHAMKGVTGMRIEDLEDVTLKNININDVHNYGQQSTDHTEKCSDEQYRGGDAFGIVFGNIDTVHTEGTVTMLDIVSDAGVASSVALNGEVNNFKFTGNHNNWQTEGVSSATLATEFYTCPTMGTTIVKISWEDHATGLSSCPVNICTDASSCGERRRKE